MPLLVVAPHFELAATATEHTGLRRGPMGDGVPLASPWLLTLCIPVLRPLNQHRVCDQEITISVIQQ